MADDDATIRINDESKALLPNRFDVSEAEPVANTSKKTESSRYALFGYTALLLFAAVGNSYFFKRQTDAFPNYSYYLNQVTTGV